MSTHVTGCAVNNARKSRTKYKGGLASALSTPNAQDESGTHENHEPPDLLCDVFVRRGIPRTRDHREQGDSAVFRKLSVCLGKSDQRISVGAEHRLLPWRHAGGPRAGLQSIVPRHFRSRGFRRDRSDYPRTSRIIRLRSEMGFSALGVMCRFDLFSHPLDTDGHGFPLCPEVEDNRVGVPWPVRWERLCGFHVGKYYRGPLGVVCADYRIRHPRHPMGLRRRFMLHQRSVPRLRAADWDEIEIEPLENHPMDCPLKTLVNGATSCELIDSYSFLYSGVAFNWFFTFFTI